MKRLRKLGYDSITVCVCIFLVISILAIGMISLVGDGAHRLRR